MEDLEPKLLQTRKARRIEQVVAKWLHRSRDGTSRSRVSVTDTTNDGSGQPVRRVKLTVTVYKDLVLGHYGFEICPNLPLTIASVTAGSTAEGKLQPGDHLLLINSTAVDDVSVERAADIIRKAGDELLLTVQRCTSVILRTPPNTTKADLGFGVGSCPALKGGPKSSFLTAEKRARLKTNPVKVRFAEEVLVNGHAPIDGGLEACQRHDVSVLLSVKELELEFRAAGTPQNRERRNKEQDSEEFVLGNSLLCMPNVLKVYLENGQTKAFRFETSTTVKDIVLTLKEKLSLRSIAHFALALEEQYSVAKIRLLHEEELIEQVVQKRESHDYRCLFRVCFVPKDPLDLLQEDPVAFEYLYLQSCSDVLQERFAVEMKCSVALRLAALHIQERIYTCAQPQKISLKYIERDWGIENFISPTLLRNMRGKDIKKAISYHMKRNQVLLDPRQKHMLAAVQVRLSYLQILGDLKMYNGKIFNATLMLQDRESYVALLVGAKYGVSQIINNKLNIITSLAEFTNISRVELMEESEKVSMVKIYLQDLKVLALLLESNSAKDLVCLITGYYRLFVDANVSIFTWGEKKQQLHHVSAEEGYESRTCSDSEDSWDLDSSSEHGLDTPIAYGSGHLVCPEEELEELQSLEKDSRKPQTGGSDWGNGSDNATDSTSEASDSANTESRGFKTSGSSDSMDALDEDELEACSLSRPEFFHFYTPTVQELSSSDKSFFPIRAAGGSSMAETKDYFCFLQVSRAEEPEHEGSPSEQSGEDVSASVLETKLSERNTMDYYSLCYSACPADCVERSNVSCSPESPWEDETAQAEAPRGAEQTVEASDLILEPPPGFGDTSSEEEFYDAADRLSPRDALAAADVISREGTDNSSCILKKPRCYSSGEGLMTRQTAREKHRKEKLLTHAKSLRKRRSFLKTDYTSQVTFPLALPGSLQSCCSWPPSAPLLAQLPTSLSSEKDTELGHPPATQAWRDPASRNSSSDLVEMEPDTMETKSVTDRVVSPISVVRLQGAQHKEESSGIATPADSAVQPAEAVHPPALSPEEDAPLPGGQSRVAQENSSEKTDTGRLREESCVATGGWQELEGMGKVAAAKHEVDSVCPFLHQEVPCPANEHPQLPPAHEAAGGHGLPPTAGRHSMCEEPAPALHEERQAISAGCAGHGRDGASSQMKSRQVVNKEALRKVHSKNQVGFPDATQLLTDCSSTSGVITRLSWLSFGMRTDHTSPSPSQERVGDPQETKILVSQETSGCHGTSAVRRETETSAAEPPFEKELMSNQGLDEGQPSKDAGNMAHSQPWPAQTPFTRKQDTEVGKACLLTLSPGLSISSGPIPLGSLGKRAGEHVASKQSFLCFNLKKDEQTPPDPITTRSLGFSTMKTLPLQLGMDKCSCQMSYISCFHMLNDKGEQENCVSPCSTFLGPLTTPPPSSRSLPGTSVSSYSVSIARDMTSRDPHVQALSHLKDQARMSPADFSRFLAYTIELQEVVEKLSGNQATHLQEQCTEQSAESKGALGLASRDLLSSCQELLKTEQPFKELQEVLRVTFNHLVQLAVACFRVTHCQLCRQRQPELGAALVDVVGTYHQLVQAVQQQLRRQGCPDLGAKLLARQHTALTAAMFCLLQQFRAPTLL